LVARGTPELKERRHAQEHEQGKESTLMTHGGARMEGTTVAGQLDA
jgi:hypothetical protein